MSDQTTDQLLGDTTEVVDQAPAEAVDQPDTPETDTPDEGKEAAKYRRRLRDTEKERDALLEQVDTLRREAIERLAAQHLAKPEGLWAAGVTVDQLLDDDGHIDQKKVTAATQAAITDLGLARKLSNHVPREGGNPRPGGGDRFTEAFSPR
ncbi:hypothetical protein [Rhodococcus sp. SJ]|uniref:hypothetical protein n=1 Tax=Rhodococcus sp. SJ TaxID=3434112 RepID=UPI003D78EA45